MAQTSSCVKRQDIWGAEVAFGDIQPSPRIQMLRERHVNLKPRVGHEMALFWTQAFKESEAEPVIIRRAEAVKKYALNHTLCVHPGELIIGGWDRRPLSTIHVPDITCDWLEDELDIFPTREFDPMVCDDETKRIYREEIIPYWKGKTFSDIWQQRASSVAPEAYKVGFETCISEQQSITFFTLNHFIPGWHRVIEKGFVGIKKEIQQHMKNLDSAIPDYFEKATYYKAVLTVCDAVTKYGIRWAEYARKLAGQETDPQIKADYLKMAEVCEQVPAKPARNFHEALQALYFSNSLMINDAASIGYGRMDQYLYPYYRKDIEKGVLTQEEAQDLIDCFMIKSSEQQMLFSAAAARYAVGARGANNIDVGGVDEDGFDVSNELSYMILQSMINVRLAQPLISLLYHPGTPEDLLLKACKLACVGTGHPSIFSNPRLIEMLQELGLPLKEARRGCIVGCVEPSAEAGKANTCSNFGYLNLGVMMEFALNQGIWRMNNEQMGYPTADPRTFTSYDQVVTAFKNQLEYLVHQHVTLGQITEKMHAEFEPDPFADLFYEDCLENAKNLYDGGAKYSFGPGILFTGVADIINSLAAIKYLVFDEKKLTMAELLDALASDFEGTRGEEICRMCLSIPKYGNDDPYVDSIAKEIMRLPPEETGKYTAQYGQKWRAAIIPITTIFPFGMVTGALPSGRKAGTQLAEGCSPKQGTDLHGPTASMKSVTAFDHSQWLDGTQLNIKFSPNALKDRRGLMNMAALVKTYLARGGFHVQFNVVNKETLQAAQKNPEEYKGLTVRVSGYNSYFTALSKEMQDDIIDRTEHMVTI